MSYSSLLAEGAYRDGRSAAADNMQRVVPSGLMQDYRTYWLAGYDGKTFPQKQDKPDDE